MRISAGRLITGLVLLLFIVGVALTGERLRPSISEVISPRTAIVLFYSTPQGDKLIPVERIVPIAFATPEGVLVNLIEGPKTGDLIMAASAPVADATELVNPIPDGTELRSLRVEDGVAYADFSREIVTNHPGGSAGEIATVYSIVNTLTEFPEIAAVMITIEGERRESLVGHLDLTRPLRRDDSLVWTPASTRGE